MADKKKSKTLEKLLTNLTIDRYEDREELLKIAKQEAFNSRQGTYVALAYAYQWWAMSQADKPYMTQKFEQAKITVPESDKPHYRNSTIKLIFDLAESKYASRVTEYALVLQYIESKMDHELYADMAEDPSVVIAIIKDGDGIRKCAEEQRKANNPSGSEPTQADINQYLQTQCTNIYKSRAAEGSIKVDTPATSSGFVMMIGRPDQAGNVEVVEVMSLEAEQIYALTRERVLNDTSNLSETLNVLGDALGYLHAFPPKEEPVVTVERGGEAIYISLDNENETSLTVVARLKKPDVLQGFKDRSHLSMKDKAWFREKAQSRVTRRLYDLAVNNGVKSATVAYDLTNNVDTNCVKTLHFNAMTPSTIGQVMRKSLRDADWLFKAGFGRADIEEIHEWCKGWLTVKRNTASARIVPVTVDHENITFGGDKDGASVDLVIPAATGLSEGQTKKYRVFGRELAKVMEQLYLNADINGFYIQAPDGGLVEITAEDSLLAYQIDIPTVLKGDVNHSPVHFTNL